jgi:hypothetical protein
MAAAYESDGRTFLSADDPVNALAAFFYGLGWVHCGTALGILAGPDLPPACPFAGTWEEIPARHREKLEEKAGRYSRLLATALESVSPAPESGTPAHAAALMVRFIAERYRDQGSRSVGGSRREEGLACFSYGHGWLDAGVEAGLFSVHANRGIFTL